MIATSSLERLVKRFRSSQSGPVSDVALVHPVREWFLGIVVALLLSLAGGVFSMWLYNNVQAAAAEVTVAALPVPYNAEVTAAALKVLAAREQVLTALVGTTPTPAVETPSEALDPAVGDTVGATSTAPASEEAEEGEMGEVVIPSGSVVPGL